MRYRGVRAPLLSALIAGLAGTFGLFVGEGTGQSSASYRAARLPGTDQPNLDGVWQALNTANYNLEGDAARPAPLLQQGLYGEFVPAAPFVALGAYAAVPGGAGVVEGNEIPYQPAAVAKRKQNAANTLALDPEVKCLLPGVPRATYLPYPFRITQGTNKIMIAYGYTNAGRTIHLDKVDPPMADSWMGHSVGRWEGDTLVVEVTNLREETWFDRAGNFHSDALRVTERYTPITPSHMTYEATIEDPKVFTRPWKMRMPLYKRMEENPQVFEFKCIQFVEELVYGHLRKKPLVKHWEADYGWRGGTVGIDISRQPSQEPQ